MKWPIIVLLVLLGLTVRGRFSSIISCGVPLLGPLSVPVPMVTVASVWPPAQGDMNPNVESAVTWRQQAKGTIRFSSLSFNCTLMIQWVFVPRGVIYESCIQKKEKKQNKTINPQMHDIFLKAMTVQGRYTLWDKYILNSLPMCDTKVNKTANKHFRNSVIRKIFLNSLFLNWQCFPF